ncbi:MAG: hypothetical protein PWQ93_1350 [Clostridiales bacterium]|nr:hypothetical protein [Clostridiales bacterium]
MKRTRKIFLLIVLFIIYAIIAFLVKDNKGLVTVVTMLFAVIFGALSAILFINE